MSDFERKPRLDTQAKLDVKERKAERAAYYDAIGPLEPLNVRSDETLGGFRNAWDDYEYDCEDE